MAVVTFGVTSSLVDAATSWIDIGSSSDPNTTRVSALIEAYAAPLNLALEGAGISPAAIDTGSALYATCQGALVLRVSAAVVLQNAREDSDYCTQAREEWDNWLARIRSRELGTVGTDPAPVSSVQGAFNAQTIVTTQPSRNPRLGMWRKGRGFN